MFSGVEKDKLHEMGLHGTMIPWLEQLTHSCFAVPFHPGIIEVDIESTVRNPR